MKKNRHISLQECYALLQLTQDATLEDVKKSYRRRAFELHPDLNPTVADASQQFQRLNEAYVALSQILQTEESDRKESAKQEEKKQKEADKQGKKEEKNKKTEEKTSKEDKKKKQDQEQKSKEQAQSHRQRAASAAYAKEDVLRDLLHDPFARRVFEDIYSEVSKQAGPETKTENTASNESKPKPEPKPTSQTHTVEVDLGKNKNSARISNKFSGKIMSWFRQQIDEEQSIKMPPSALFAGAKIRLQIRQGLSEDLSTIEIVLPKDFVAGKPIRLRGLGKKVGKWQGDLYLTIESNQT